MSVVREEVRMGRGRSDLTVSFEKKYHFNVV